LRGISQVPRHYADELSGDKFHFMLRSIYTSTASMLTSMEQTATTANNLANVDTNGFKRDLLSFNSEPTVKIWRTDDPTYLDINGRQIPKLMGELSTGVTDTVVFRDQSAGKVHQTGNPLDLMLHGNGYLRVSSPNGERYTRDGSLSISQDGFLCTHEGFNVLGLSGPIQMKGVDAQITRSGTVIVNGSVVDVLSIAHFEDPQALRKDGSNLWSAEEAKETSGSTEVHSGMLEGSNVDVSRSIVDLIAQSRHFELASKALRTGDEILNIIANQLARMPQ
jgi:flagellar basal-body rod protein FlgG